jgi:hypothetical protein
MTFKKVLAFLVFLTVTTFCFGQETTGGLQGAVKDSSGAVIPKAKVVLTGTTLVGAKELSTDASGNYRFANLPPGLYTLTITAPGFSTSKREGIAVEVGHLPTQNITLAAGAATTTVEVTAAAPLIDPTTVTSLTNITNDVIEDVPHGTSFQSVIQFAPMARNEPLAGSGGGTGGSSPGSSGNGLGFGYSIGGAADSENSYLVEGQDTESISTGYSKASVPMEFIDQVEIETSGISAEHGGALGGVVNVVMKKGGNGFHGQLFGSYESSGTDANQSNAFLRYDPTGAGATTTQDPYTQLYHPLKDHFRNIEPGISVGGPIWKDKIWFFGGFEPYVNTLARTVNFGNPTGSQYFTQDRQTYFTTFRIDAALTSKIRVFGSWLYQYARETGDSLPGADPTESSYLNTSTEEPLTQFAHGIGWSAPNATYNFGADVTLTPRLVATTRYGYFFENYHDFGWQTSTPNLGFATSGVGQVDNAGNPLPAALQQNAGYSTAPYTGTYTLFNASKHYQFNQDFAYSKSGWLGNHYFKFGYQLNHLSNVIDQNGNVPNATLVVGPGFNYTAATSFGGGNCTKLSGEWGGNCTGQYGFVEIVDFATVLTKPASDWNHAFYVQDSWTIGKGLTIDAGLRLEKENLPSPPGYSVPGINFGWGDKIAPRVGAAWDPTQKGKMKLFASFGVVNDVMKLLLAQTSFGAQAYEICTYPLGPPSGGGTFDLSDIDLTFNAGRACPSGSSSTPANFSNGSAPSDLVDAKTGVSLIENVNYRPWEPVSPGVKPYRQHEYVAGFDYQINPTMAFEVRYDRRRLDHILEDASLSDPNNFEIYTIVNPGEGVNKTIDGYSNYLSSLGDAYGEPNVSFNPTGAFGTCTTCPANPKAVRNYDGVELRLTKALSHGWSGMVSYTYSSLWGNYTGLTTTDQSDGGAGGRASPDTTRSFDEPFYYFGANGKSNNGPLPTDRPNTFKGYGYYQLPWWKNTQKTTLGLFQYFYQGSPVGSYIDLLDGSGGPIEATYIYGRGKWVGMNTDSSGNITLGNPYARRTPWYIQSDLSASHQIKTGPHQTFTFEATAQNLFNLHAITGYNEAMNSWYHETGLYPGVAAPGNSTGQPAGSPINVYSGAALYQEVETGYNPQQWINGNGGQVPRVIQNSLYGKANLFQYGRTIRLAARFTF